MGIEDDISHKEDVAAILTWNQLRAVARLWDATDDLAECGEWPKIVAAREALQKAFLLDHPIYDIALEEEILEDGE